MKSIFKKIAFVLALAMIVTMLPAKAASAATSDGPQIYPTLRLYIGGDATDTYAEENYAKVWNKDGYTVAFESDAEEVATVNAKGYVRAVSVGTANITATFTAKDGTTVTKTCVVTVKKNATKAGIGAKDKAALEAGITVGTEMQLVSVRKDENDVVARKGKVDLTDGMRFESSDETVFTVGPKLGKLIAVGPGEATLTVWAVQTEGSDPNTDDPFTKYVPTTEKKVYTVVVKAPMSAEQSAHNAFDVTFDTEDTAKKAVEETSKYLTSASAAVTEQEDIVKVYEVLKDKDGKVVGETAVIIGNLTQSNNHVKVEMFDELAEGTDYIIRYLDQEVTVTTTQYVAAKLTVSGEGGVIINEDSSKTNVVVRIFADGTNGQPVDITECRKYRGWQDSVTITDVSSDLTGYNLVIGKIVSKNENQNNNEKVEASAEIYFYNKTATVTVEAKFLDYFNEAKPGNPLMDRKVISANDHTFISGVILDWGIVNTGTDHSADGAFSTKEFAADDLGKQLIVQAEITYKDGTSKAYNCCEKPSLFTFKTQNEDKLIVDEATGELFPPKEPQDGIVNVYVYYDGQYIGFCAVKVWAKRELSGFTMSVDSQKLSYNLDGDVLDTIKLTLTPTDQLNELFTINMSINVKMYGITSNNAYQFNYLRFFSDESCSEESELFPSSDEQKLSVDLKDESYTIWIQGTEELPTAVRNIRILGTATYSDNVNKKTLNAAASFNAKNTKNETPRTYGITTLVGNTSTNSVNMNLNNRSLGADTSVRIQAYSIDKDGFKIAHLSLAPGYSSSVGSGNVITVNQFGEYADEDHLVQAGKDLIFHTVTASAIGAAASEVVNTYELKDFQITGWKTVTGGAINAATRDGKMLEKLPVGNYQITLFVNEKYGAGSVIAVKDDETIGWTWANHSLEYSVEKVQDVLAAIRDAFIFDLIDESEIYAGYIDEVNGEYRYVLKDDFVVQGEYVSVKQVRYLRTSGSYYYEVIIPINHTLKVVVIH